MHQQLYSRVWVAVVVVAACGDDMSRGMTVTTEPPTPEVVVRTDPANAADCPYGGTVVSSGLDANGNGALDDSEIRTRTRVCNDMPAQPPPRIAIRLVAEPPGTPCAEGGTAVQSGPDTNGNGRLDDEEVDHTDFVCGAQLVTRFTPEPPGANCVAGGIAFQVGRDRDGNGALSDDEVEHTDFSCGDILARSVQITSAADAATLAHIRVIDGSLDASDGRLDELSLPELEHVTGFVGLSSIVGLTRISLPALADVGLSVAVQDDASLTSVDLTRLGRIGDSLIVRNNPVLVDATLGASTSVGNDVVIDGNAALTAAHIPIIVGGDIEVRDDPALTSLTLLFADRVNQLTVVNTGVQHLLIAASAIRSIEGVLASVFVEHNPALDKIDVLTDRIGRLAIEHNDGLHQISVLAASWDGDVTLINPHMDQVVLDGNTLDAPVAIAGGLVVQGPVTGLFGFSPIEIAGNFTLEGTQLTSLDNIRHVGGKLRVAHNPRFLGESQILTLGGGLEVVGNDVLPHAFFIQQDTINGSVTVTDNPALRSVQALLLATTVHGNVTIIDNPSMIGTLGGISVIDGLLAVQNNPALTELDFTGLQRVHDVSVFNNAALPEVSLPALTAVSSIQIDSNPALHHVVLSALLGADFIRIDHNHALPSCEVLAMYQHIAGGPFEQSDNDDVTACTP